VKDAALIDAVLMPLPDRDTAKAAWKGFYGGKTRGRFLITLPRNGVGDRARLGDRYSGRGIILGRVGEATTARSNSW